MDEDSVGCELDEEFDGFCLLCAEPMTKKQWGEDWRVIITRGIGGRECEERITRGG